MLNYYVPDTTLVLKFWTWPTGSGWSGTSYFSSPHPSPQPFSFCSRTLGSLPFLPPSWLQLHLSLCSNVTFSKCSPWSPCVKEQHPQSLSIPVQCLIFLHKTHCHQTDYVLYFLFIAYIPHWNISSMRSEICVFWNSAWYSVTVCSINKRLVIPHKTPMRWAPLFFLRLTMKSPS